MAESSTVHLMARKPIPEKGSDDFGKLLRQLRKSRGWTQAQLAQNAGIERAMVGNYELGVHYPPIPTLVKLARTLDVSVDRLLGLVESGTEDIQDRRLYQLFKDVDRADFGTQGLIKQVVEGLLISARSPRLRTGTKA